MSDSSYLDHALSSSEPEYPSPTTDNMVDELEASVGLAHPEKSQGRRRMLDLVNRLHNTGVQVDIDLPQIAVIGAQSAGKSSLIESISGITLPRASGTCTRCPTECRLSRNHGPWKCVVSLCFITDRSGQNLGQATTQPFGDVIYDKTQVEDRIRRAQLAILNPTKPAKYFLESDDERYEAELSFSRNFVSLEISGPDVADLSFCDLPGLIASVSSSTKGSGNDIALVENLVTSYIKRPSCIILLTVACETDFENQGAHQLTKCFDPDGKSTIGVLTKPDRIPTGEEGNWLPFIRNEKEPLQNNWFCVKQPSSNDLRSNITWKQARDREMEFFATTAPWCELDEGYQKYLRTSNLIERLSLVLSDLISKRLPEIYEELERSIASARDALSSLPPPPPDNPQSEISNLLHDFMSDLARHVQGVPDEDGLLQAILPAQEKFRMAIRETAPNFRPFEKRFEGKRHMGRVTFLATEEGRTFDDEDSEDENCPVAIEEPDSEAQFEQVSSGRGLVAQSHPKSKKSKIFIDQVLQRANRARTRELPGHYPFVVQKTIIEEIIKEWKVPALALCKSVYVYMSEHVKNLITKHFVHFGQGYLEQRVKTIMHKHLQGCLEMANAKVLWLLDLEQAHPFSLNTHYISDYKTKFLTFYRAERQRHDQSGLSLAAALASFNQTQGQGTVNSSSGLVKVMEGLAAMGLMGIKANDLKKLIPDDEMDPALTIMADVRAYFQVAFKRFTDTVPLAIDHELVRGVERNILGVLNVQLGVTGPEGHEISKDLAQESLQVADRRADLGKKLERLEVAHKELLGIAV